MCSQQLLAGETLAIMVVLELPVKESFRTWVSLLPLKGKCFFSRSRARMHSLRANNDLLISAPSIFVCLFVFIVSAPRSEPAKSIKLILPYSLPLCLSCIWRIACERELSAFAPVYPEVRFCRPMLILVMMSSVTVIYFSVRPTMFTFCFASSRHTISSRLFSRSNSFPQ